MAKGKGIHGGKLMSTIVIKEADIVTIGTDAVVNAANEGLWEGGGVCGAIFAAAGSRKLTIIH